RPPAVSRPRAIFTPTKRWPRRVGMVAAFAAVYHRARFAWSAQHDPRGCFDLSRSRSLLRGDDGMDIASLARQTVLEERPGRPALRGRGSGIAAGRGIWSRSGVKNRLAAGFPACTLAT